jgi:hypothetical protein
MEITKQFFLDSLKQFDKIEKRTGFFRLASNLVKENKYIEAYVIILATWNFAGFRFFLKEFDLNSFRELLDSIEKEFINLSNATLIDSKFSEYKDNIKKIYELLSSKKGIQYTGATKIMHLRNPNLFVIWDDYIRGGKPFKKYKQLDVFKNNILPIQKYHTNSEGYFEFLNDMRNRFSEFANILKGKTLAKAIDEFNYVNITIEYQNKFEKKIKKI